MKVIILAGGKGTRISEYTDLIPKPMIRVGDEPIGIVVIMSCFPSAKKTLREKQQSPKAETRSYQLHLPSDRSSSGDQSRFLSVVLSQN
mgnify:CR=1 FL=1